MTYQVFYKAMHSFLVFSYEDIRGIFGSIDRRRLHEWTKRGYIIPLIKGYYVFSEFSAIEGLPLLISNKIYAPSYISLEYVMSQHSLIPEAVFTITAVSTRKTNAFHTDCGNFSYHSIKDELFTGYGLESIPVYFSGKQSERHIRTASLEKAFFDFIYFRCGHLTNEQIKQYRFDVDVLASVDRDAVHSFIETAGIKSLESNWTTILKYHDLF